MKNQILFIVLICVLCVNQAMATPSVPTVTATDAEYIDKIIISVSTNIKNNTTAYSPTLATGYKYEIWKSDSSTCNPMNGSCQRIYVGYSKTYTDTSVVKNKKYYYFAKTCSSRTECSSYSPFNIGYTGRITQYMRERDEFQIVSGICFENWPGCLTKDSYEAIRNEMYPPDRTRKIVDIGRLPYKIAGLGDSYGAGAGNPSENGTYIEPWLPDSMAELTPVEWNNRQCKRSNRSGFNYGVEELNSTQLFNATELRDFVDFNFTNYACGGSETKHILDTNRKDLGNGNYEKMYDRNNPPIIIPQTNAMKNEVENSEEKFDAVLMSIGGNDSGFGPAILACALGDCTKNLFIDGQVDVGIDWISGLGLNDYAIDVCSQTITGHSLNIANFQEVADIRYLNFFESLSLDDIINIGTVRSSSHDICTVLVGTAYLGAMEMLSEAEALPEGHLLDQYKKIDYKLRHDDIIKEKAPVYLLEYHDIAHDKNNNFCDMDTFKDMDAFVAGVNNEEFGLIYNSFYLNLLRGIDKAKNIKYWNVVNLHKDSSHGICEDSRYVNLNIEALRKEGADIVPAVPLSGGMIHPNDSGYHFAGRQIKDAMFPEIAVKLEQLSREPTPTSLAAFIETSLSSGEQITIVWDDMAAYETAYKVQLFKVEDPTKITYSRETPILEAILDRNQTQFQVLTAALGRDKMFDVSISTCQISDLDCSFPARLATMRVRYGHVSQNDYVLSSWGGRITYCNRLDDPKLIFNLQNSTGQADKVLLAWSEIDKETTEETLDEYLVDNELDFNLEWQNVNNEIYLRPLPFRSKDKKFVVSAKYCNINMCSGWSSPLIAQYPDYTPGGPLVCDGSQTTPSNDRFHPQDIRSIPSNIIRSRNNTVNRPR